MSKLARPHDPRNKRRRASYAQLKGFLWAVADIEERARIYWDAYWELGKSAAEALNRAVASKKLTGGI